MSPSLMSACLLSLEHALSMGTCELLLTVGEAHLPATAG